MKTPANTACGRFAPSPTGPLHFGSLVAALGSWLHARSRGTRWLVRIDDLDTPRCVPGAADEILRTLEVFGLCWDGEVLRQDTRRSHYAAALESLQQAGLVYGCACTRREIGNAPYPGTCRDGPRAGRSPRALRVRTDDEPVGFTDLLQGPFCQRLRSEIGDFIVRRADGLHAYHLAVVVDDAAQGVTEIVRGADLLDSTPRQIYLQRLLGLPLPDYAHLPVAVDANGAKLSKQNHATPVERARPSASLAAALRFLGHAPPGNLHGASAAELLAWALEHFRLAAVPRCRTLPSAAPA